MIEILLGHFTWLVSGFLIAVAFLWAIARSQSLFEVRYRLWRLVRSGHEISDDAVRKAVQERADLVSFRTLLVWADTPGEMRRILGYAQQHELDLGVLGDCGPYFHRRDLAIKPNVPSLGMAKAIYTFMRLFFFLLAVFAGCFFVQQRVLISFNDDGTRAWLGTREAQLFGIDQPRLLTGNCPKANAGAAGFNATHTKVLCEAFGDKDVGSVVDDGVRRQRVLCAALAAFAAAGFVYGRRRFHQVRAAQAVKQWLAYRQKPKGQDDGGAP